MWAALPPAVQEGQADPSPSGRCNITRARLFLDSSYSPRGVSWSGVVAFTKLHYLGCWSM